VTFVLGQTRLQHLETRVANILAIRFARLGDVVLLLQALGQLRSTFPEANLSLITGIHHAPLARLCPYLDEVIAVDRHAMSDGPKFRAIRDISALIHTVRSRQFDLAIDFHSFRETNLLTCLSGAQYRLGLKRSNRSYLSFCFNVEPVLEDKSLHVGEMFSRVASGAAGGAVPNCSKPNTSIVIPEDIRDSVRNRYLPDAEETTIVAVYVGASVSSRRWPTEHFAAIADHVAAVWEANVLILTGISSVEQAIGLEVEKLIKRHDRVQLVAGLDLPSLAGAIGLASLLVSNDTGPMHIGPALGVPTLGIFSQSSPVHYRPVGRGDRYVKKKHIEEVKVAEVIEIMGQMWDRHDAEL